jgi:methyl-accepting chemotaxis protein
MITAGLIALLTTIGVSLAAYFSARETIEAQIAKQLTDVSRRTMAAEEAYLEDRVEEIRQLVFSQLQSSPNAQYRSRVLFDYARAFGEQRYADLSILDLNGKVVASTGTPVIDGVLAARLRSAARPGIVPNVKFGDQTLPVDVVYAPLDTVTAHGFANVSSVRTGTVIGRLEPTEMVHLLRSVPIDSTTALFLTRNGVVIGESRGARAPRFGDGKATTAMAPQEGTYDLHLGVTALVDTNAAYAPVRDLAWRSLAIGFAVFCIAAFIGVLTARRIARPLVEVADAAHRFAQGDLTAHVDTSRLRVRELRDLGASFNLLAQTLRSLIEGIETTSRTIFASVRNNLDTAISVSTGTDQQAKASTQISMALAEAGSGARQIGSDCVELEQRSRIGLARLDALVGEVDRTNAALGRLSDSINRSNQAGRALAEQSSAVAAHAKLVGERAIDASNAAEEGRQAVRGLIADIQNVGSSLLDTVERLEHLADASAKAIQAQIDVVSDIAERSKLLALNAGIEAARAGEAGRGFSVIAGELHRLASGSKSAGDEASVLVRDVVAETQRLISQARSASGLARAAIGRASVTGSSIDELVLRISENAHGAGEIGSIADEQARRSHDIEVATSEMRELADVTARAAQTVWDLSREVRGAVDLATNVATQVSTAAGQQIETFAVIQQNAREIERATAAAARSAQDSLASTHDLQSEVEALVARLGGFASGSAQVPLRPAAVTLLPGAKNPDRAAVEAGVA